MKIDTVQDQSVAKHSPEKRIKGFSYAVVIIMSILGILLCVNQLFQLNLAGFMPIASGYYYYVLVFFLSISFLIFPGRKADSKRLCWYDWGLFLITIVVNVYFALNAELILTEGWEYSAPKLPLVFSFVLWALALEGVRRTAGMALFIICLIFSFYPVFGQYLKGILWGTPFSLIQTATYHAIGVESIIGIALRVIGDELVGYIIFGAAIVSSGGGQFFMNFALSLLGKSRGGAAKVSVISSGFMASLSGSVVSNIVTTGTLTIPLMKRTGYSATYAAAIEACASSGGTITPPIMGAAGFLIASFMGVPYTQVILAAIVPAFLYFYMVYLQVDLHAAKNKIEGFDTSQIPKLLHTLKTGWFFIGAIFLLIFILVYYRITSIAPFFAIIFLFLCACIQKETRMTWEKICQFLYQSGLVVGQITAILAGIGLIIGSLSAIGVANSFSRELLLLAGDNVFLLLLLGAMTSLILGIGMTVTAVYVFLAVVLVPALVKAGFDPMASHLFVLFCGNLSYITPPVALGSIAAATIAGSQPMKTAFKSSQLGLALFILPFLFVVNPALILNGTASEIARVLVEVLIGCYFFSVAFEGWFYGFGRIAILHRILFFLAGAMLLYPNWKVSVGGIVFTCIALSTVKIFPYSKVLRTEQ